MFKLIFMALEQVVGINITESFFDEIKSSKKEKMAKSLFLLYLSLNDIIINGRKIIESIEEAPRWLEKKRASGELDRVYFTGLEYSLERQAEAISAFVNNLLELRPSLAAMSAKADIRLNELLDGKYSAVSGLLLLLRSGKLAYDFKDGFNIEEPDKVVENHREFPKSVQYYKTFHIKDISKFRVEEKDAVLELISELPFRDQLEQLEEIAEKIRIGLEGNFTLSDVILEVGEMGNSHKGSNNWFIT